MDDRGAPARLLSSTPPCASLAGADSGRIADMRAVDLLVVGAGPAGISLAVEARAAGVEADAIQLLEKSREHSWAIRVLYPDAKLVTANYKGIDARCEGVLCLADSSKADTLTYLDRAIAEYDLRVQYETEVFAIEVGADGGFTVRSSRG